MNLEYYYWYFPSALTNRFCDELVRYGNLQKDKTALIGGLTDNSNLNKKQLKYKVYRGCLGII